MAQSKIRIYGTIGEDFTSAGLRTNLDSQKGNFSVQIDSYGGSVDEALAAINELKANGGAESVRYVGTSASAATVVASALGVPVEAYGNVSILIHESSGAYEGKASDMADYADYIEKLNVTMAEIYAKKTGRTVAEMRELMASNNGEGRWLTAAEALDLGFIDSIVDPVAEVRAYYQEKTTNPIKNNTEMGIFDLFNKKPVATKTKSGVLLSDKALAVGVKVTTAEAMADGAEINGKFVTADGTQEVTVEAGEVTGMTDVTGMTIEEVAAKLAEVEAENEQLKAKIAEYEAGMADATAKVNELEAKVEAAAKVASPAAVTPKNAPKSEAPKQHISAFIAEKTKAIREARKNS